MLYLITNFIYIIIFLETRELDAGHQLGQGHRLHRHRDGQSQPPVSRGIHTVIGMDSHNLQLAEVYTPSSGWTVTTSSQQRYTYCHRDGQSQPPVSRGIHTVIEIDCHNLQSAEAYITSSGWTVIPSSQHS